MATSVKDRELQRQQDLERIKNFRLIDDDFMTKCFENNIEATELLLHIIMNKPNLKVVSVETQKEIKNLQGRSIRLDIHATDGNDIFDIEVQRADKGAIPQRARYNSSIIDSNTLFPNEEFKKLPESYVIFITENDVLNFGDPIYEIDRMIRRRNVPFNDGSHIIYVNGENRDNTALGLLMHDFFCKNPDDMHYKILADRVRYFKETEEGVSAMCKIIEDMCNEVELKKAQNVAIRMLKKGKLTNEDIAEYTELTLEQISALAASLSIKPATT